MANIQTAAFASLMPAAFRTGTEVTLGELFVALELDDSIPLLQRVDLVAAALASIGLVLSPGLQYGDFDSSRIMSGVKMTVPTLELVGSEISRGEDETLEFKASYLFNVAEARARPELSPDQLSAAPITYAALRTICAFANSQGGTLLVGVADDGTCCGMDADYKIVAADGRNCADRWQLRLRQDIEQHFKDGRAINEFVTLAFVTTAETRTVARVTVLRRQRLTFLRREKSPGYCAFKRQGNRSVEIPYEDIEEFLAARRR